VLHYKGDWLAGQNRFRQLIARRYTPPNAQNRSFALASGGSLTQPPFCSLLAIGTPMFLGPTKYLVL
jgi:hypothetical protein